MMNNRLIYVFPSSYLDHRRLSMYKYIRINDGPLRGCYHHPSFVRNQFDLIDQVGRKDLDSINAPASSHSTQGSAQIRKNKTSTRAISSAATQILLGATPSGSSGATTISRNEDDEFRLFDFDYDTESVVLEEMPSVFVNTTIFSKNAPATGVFDLRQDISPKLASTKQQLFDEAATFSLYSHCKPGVLAPTDHRKDILDEIIRTFN